MFGILTQLCEKFIVAHQVMYAIEGYGGYTYAGNMMTTSNWTTNTGLIS